MNILDKIVEHKKREVEENNNLHPIKELEQGSHFSRQTVSLKKSLLQVGGSGIIAEIKRKSPSKGIINPNVSVQRTSAGYIQAGASALSILTDRNFFGGSNVDLSNARSSNDCPILRKDFIIDRYQIIEAKSIGADAILLIAAVLAPDQLKELCVFAHSLGLEVLMEIHNEEELWSNVDAGVDLIGVNNRNLKTFDLNVETSRQLSKLIPDTMVKVSESGIESPETIIDLKRYGFRGFLIGQTFMQNRMPEKAAMEFINELRRLELSK